eukprot:scaffold22285_cov70-Cyclotella_meneghiniana.AAC.7
MIVGLRSWGVVHVDRRDGHGKVKVNAWILLSNIRKQIVSSLVESFILYQFGLLHINNSQMHGVEMLSWFMGDYAKLRTNQVNTQSNQVKKCESKDGFKKQSIKRSFSFDSFHHHLPPCLKEDARAKSPQHSHNHPKPTAK